MENHTALQQDHPLSLSSSLETSIEKLLRHKVLDLKTSSKDDIDDIDDDDADDGYGVGSLLLVPSQLTKNTVTYQLHAQFNCPQPCKDVDSAIQLAKNISQLRRDAECEFWSQRPRPKHDIDRVWIVDRCCEVGKDRRNDPCHEEYEDLAHNDTFPATITTTAVAAVVAATAAVATTTTDDAWKSKDAHDARQPPRIQADDPRRMTALQLKQKYLYTNTPCIIKNVSIPITEQWYQRKPIMANHECSNHDIAQNNNGNKSKGEYQINTDWFLENIGYDTMVPIRINQEGYQYGRAAECLTSKVTMKSWIEERTNHPNPRHYLKDWHMQSLFQHLYDDPIVFDDVLNPFLIDNDGGDYRFVYWGCKGSSTGIHSDVLNTFSWSFNVIGTKRWTFYLKDDVNGSGEGAIVVDQHQGEMMYVPSGWRHSVVNLEEAISVNHNWMMVGSLDFVFDCLLDEIKAIEDEMDAWGMIGTGTPGLDKELSRVREDMLRGCVGMDLSMFCILVIRCFTNCLVDIMNPVRGADGSIDCSRHWESWFDFTRIVKILGKLLDTAIYDERDSITDDSEYEDDKVIIDMNGRLYSTLGQVYAEQTIDLMHSLHDIGCRAICDDRRSRYCATTL
jgi:hypothetical protein